MLIELLVVVLIIGILAAVAFPQYEKAVMKSRMNSIFPLLKSIKDAQEVYYLANGAYTNDLTKLDVRIPQEDLESNPSSGITTFRNGTWIDSFFAQNEKSGWNLHGGIGDYFGGGDNICYFTIYLDHSSLPGLIRCYGNHSQCPSICKTFDFVTQ